jgi:hypothetical protein
MRVFVIFTNFLRCFHSIKTLFLLSNQGNKCEKFILKTFSSFQNHFLIKVVSYLVKFSLSMQIKLICFPI